MSTVNNTPTPDARTTYRLSIECGKQSIVLETGKIAFQTTETVMVKCGDTRVIVPLVAAQQAALDANFFPLAIHFHKPNYADGHIPGGYRRREDRHLSEPEKLVSRLIDRPLRAVFPSGFYNEVQISPLVASSDPDIKSDVLAMLGAFTTLALSGLPTRGAVAGVRVGYIDNEFVLNPTQTEMESSKLDLVVAGTTAGILMIEAEADAITKEVIIEAVLFGYEKVKSIAQQIEEFVKTVGIPAWEWSAPSVDVDLVNKMETAFKEELKGLYQIKDKVARKAKRSTLCERIFETLRDEAAGITDKKLERILSAIESQYMKETVLASNERLDGRDSRTIRPIQIESGLLPRAHGSALFTRGETQALVTATLGSERDAQLVEGLDGVTRRDAFLLHYNFAPYCVGETGQIGSPKRREIGHGNLAKRAMRSVLPNERECPYTIRVVSEIMSSNGSSSMATVCGASLALMQAGVPLKSHVAGIAMGLVKLDERFVVLSDISEAEDHIGDMDLKVAGTREGITALQMDIKTDNITHDMLSAAITQAEEGIHTILDKMDSVISGPSQKVSPYAPQILDITIPVDKIQNLIGKGGATIRSITEETGTLIDIHRETGLIRISNSDAQACERAIQRIKEVTDLGADVEVGVVYEGTVLKVLPTGAIVSLIPGRRGFVHISEAILEHPEQTISEILKEKQRVMVKVLEVDRQTNRIKLTMKGVLTDDSEQPEINS